MARRKRIKRNQPEREGPIRNRMIPKSGDSGRAVAGNGLANGPGPALEAGLQAGRDLARVADSATRDAVEAGVETAYMVCEEYIARGREAALRYRQRSAGMDDRNTGGPWSDPWAQAWGPMAPMVAPWAQMMRMWTDAMVAFVPAWGAMAGPWLGAPGAPPRLSVLVSSETPAEVRAEVRPGAERYALRVEGLRGQNGTNAPPLEAVSIEPHGDGLRLSVMVPKDQPAGHYHGNVLDPSGAVQGQVFVEVQRATSP